MPPKKPDKPRAVEEVEPLDQSDAEEVSSEGMSDSIAGMLQTFLQRQQQREERMEKEVQCQEHKWQPLQHQFIQLQAELHQQQQEQLSMEGASVPVHEVATQAQVFTQPCFQSSSMLPWTNEEDIEHYLTTFERIAQACRWPRQDWALQILPLLSGKARAAYMAMNSEDSLNYDDVKQAILDKFERNNETYRQRFRSYSAQEDETPRELQVSLKDLYAKWMTPKHRTKEEMGDQIVLEQFLKLLNPETRTWVKQNNPSSYKHAAEMAEAFMAARQSLYQPRRWRNYSNRTGKSGDGLSSGLTNSNSSTYVPQVNSGIDTSKHQGVVSRYKGKSVIVCHACGQPGHKKVDCPIQKVSNTCLCYVPKPFLEFCEVELNRDTVIELKIGNKFFKAVVDSGSSQTLVRTECLSELGIARQGKLRVRCIHGDEREYPKTDLVIEIDNHAYNLSVGIVEQAPYPVILGRDVPVLVDLLQTDRELANVRVVTSMMRPVSIPCKTYLLMCILK